MRLKALLAYDGTDFHGWAKQKDASLRTVQGVLEANLSTILRTPVQLTVAGRTDAGVHASAQVAHFDVPAACLDTRSIHGDPQTLVRRTARMLPPDVRIAALEFAPTGFDARFSALRRHYEYRLTTNPRGALPTRHRDTAVFYRPVDVAAMNEAAQQLLGLHDFAAFCKPRPGSTTIRELQRFEWVDVSTPAEPQTYVAKVSADAFCWSMVRSLVGAALKVGAGKQPTNWLAQLLQETSRSSAYPVAPACGLTLVGVDYPPVEQLASRQETTRGLRSQQDNYCSECTVEG